MNIFSGNSKKTIFTPGSVDIPSFNRSDLSRVLPRQISTGTTRGDQQIKGKYTVVDSDNLVRVIVGYLPGGF